MKTLALLFQVFLATGIAGCTLVEYIYNAIHNPSINAGIAIAGTIMLVLTIAYFAYTVKELVTHIKTR